MEGVFASVDCQKKRMNVHRIASSRLPTKYGLFRLTRLPERTATNPSL